MTTPEERLLALTEILERRVLVLGKPLGNQGRTRCFRICEERKPLSVSPCADVCAPYAYAASRTSTESCFPSARKAASSWSSRDA